MCSVVMSQWNNCFGFLLMYSKGRSEEEKQNVWIYETKKDYVPL